LNERKKSNEESIDCKKMHEVHGAEDETGKRELLALITN
jgi:hypothetical protein